MLCSQLDAKGDGTYDSSLCLNSHFPCNTVLRDGNVKDEIFLCVRECGIVGHASSAVNLTSSNFFEPLARELVSNSTRNLPGDLFMVKI